MLLDTVKMVVDQISCIKDRLLERMRPARPRMRAPWLIYDPFCFHWTSSTLSDLRTVMAGRPPLALLLVSGASSV